MRSAGQWHGVAVPTETIPTLDSLVVDSPSVPRRVVLVGPRRAGKSSVARRIADARGVALHRIDLAAVTSKYLGETEKQLDALFDAAERVGAVLLIDEADALFGRRTDVRDAHDRYANVNLERVIERIASYAGPAVVVELNVEPSDEPRWLHRLGPIVRLPPRTR